VSTFFCFSGSIFASAVLLLLHKYGIPNFHPAGIFVVFLEEAKPAARAGVILSIKHFRSGPRAALACYPPIVRLFWADRAMRSS